jgi:hypothetical protein
MSVGTDLLMPAQRRGAALQYPICGYLYPDWQSTGSLHGVDASLYDRKKYHDRSVLLLNASHKPHLCNGDCCSKFSLFPHVVVLSNAWLTGAACTGTKHINWHFPPRPCAATCWVLLCCSLFLSSSSSSFSWTVALVERDRMLFDAVRNSSCADAHIAHSRA